MKVLLLNIDRFYDAKGGTEKVLCSMANALVDRGHQVEIVVLENKVGTSPFPLNNKVTVTNVGYNVRKKLRLTERLKRLFISGSHNRHKYDANILDPIFAKHISPVISRFAPDVIISFQIDGTRVLTNHIMPDIPIITMLHFNPVYKLNKCFDDTLKALSKSTYVQVLLESYVDITRKYIGSNNVVCIPNAVPQFEHIDNAPNTKTIIHVGRFSKVHKRQHLLIEAFNKVAKEFPEWKVEFWGESDTDPKYYKYCTDLVDKYHLTDRVKFCGTTNNISEKLSKAEMFVFPSASEGFPLALTEAMSYGLSSVGFENCSAVNELIVDKHNGILCNENVEALSTAMEQLMSNIKLRDQYGINAKKDMQEYAPESIWNKWENLLIKTINEYKKDNYTDI